MGDEENARLLLGDVTRMGCGVWNGALGSRETGQTQALLRVAWWLEVDL